MTRRRSWKTFGAETDERRVELVHVVMFVMEGVANFAVNEKELEHCEMCLGAEKDEKSAETFVGDVVELGAVNEEKKEREHGEIVVGVEKSVELGEIFVVDLNLDEVRAHDDKKELEHCEILGAEKDKKRAEQAHSEMCCHGVC